MSTQPRLLQLAWADTAYVLLGVNDNGMEIPVPVSSCPGIRLDIPSLLAAAEEELAHLLQRLLRPKEGPDCVSERQGIRRHPTTRTYLSTDVPKSHCETLNVASKNLVYLSFLNTLVYYHMTYYTYLLYYTTMDHITYQRNMVQYGIVSYRVV